MPPMLPVLSSPPRPPASCGSVLTNASPSAFELAKTHTSCPKETAPGSPPAKLAAPNNHSPNQALFRGCSIQNERPKLNSAIRIGAVKRLVPVILKLSHRTGSTNHNDRPKL